MEGIDHIVDQAALHHAAQVYLLSNQLSINFEQRWILKKLVCLAKIGYGLHKFSAKF